MQYNRLTQLERTQARTRALEVVMQRLPAKPKRENYHNTRASKYPPSLKKAIVALCFLFLLAAFVPSSIRLYDIGSNTFGHAIKDNNSMLVVGICAILLAEVGSILFTLAFAVLELKPTTRTVLAASIIGTAMVALVGNYEVALMNQQEVTLFTWLEALMPPLLTLSTAYILKEVALDDIASRFADQTAYEADLAEWNAITADPEGSQDYVQAYAGALWEMLFRKNKKAEVRAWLESLDSMQRSAMVRREMSEDEWQIEDAPAIPAAPVKPTNGNHNGNGNGHKEEDFLALPEHQYPST